MTANGTAAAASVPAPRELSAPTAAAHPSPVGGTAGAAVAAHAPTANGGSTTRGDLPIPAGYGVATVAPAAAAAVGASVPPAGSIDPRQAVIAGAVRTILGCLDAEPSRPGLVKTPDRVAKALLYCTAGSGTNPTTVAGDAVWAEPAAAAAGAAAVAGGGSGGLVLVRGIRLYSMCEHHLLPFYGTATVAYLPGAAGVLVGLSKLARLADAAARSLQVQERLTAQIADAVAGVTAAAGVAVLVDAAHLCMASRGVAQGGATTVTTAWRGAFVNNAALRKEFLTLGRQ